MLNHSASLAMSTSVLEALPGKLGTKYSLFMGNSIGTKLVNIKSYLKTRKPIGHKWIKRKPSSE